MAVELEDIPEVLVQPDATPPLTTQQRLVQGVGAGFRRPVPFMSQVDVIDQTWFQAVGDAVLNQPFWQLWNDLNAGGDLFEIDEDFRPLAEENIKGWERYAATLRQARSAQHMDAMKAQIRENEARRMRMAKNGGFMAELTAEVFNPINYIGPAWIKRGAGFAMNFARAAAGNAPFLAAEELLRGEVDPTSYPGERLGNVFYGVLFSGLLGGGVGKLINLRDTHLANRLGRMFEEEAIARDAMIEGRNPEADLAEAREAAVGVSDRDAPPRTATERSEAEIAGEPEIPGTRTDIEVTIPGRDGGERRFTFTSVRELDAQIGQIEAAQARRRGYLDDETALEQRATEVGLSIPELRRQLQQNFDRNEPIIAMLTRLRNTDEMIRRSRIEQERAANIQFNAMARGADEMGEPLAESPVSGLERGPEILRGEFVSRETDEIDPGIAKVYGLEKLQGAIPGGLPFARLLNSGYRAVADFALSLASEHDIMLARNWQGQSTPESAALRAGFWTAKGAQFEVELKAIYNDYLTGGGGRGKEVLGLNPGVEMARAQQALRRTSESIRSTETWRKLDREGRFSPSMLQRQEKMDYLHFKSEVTRAFKQDKIDAEGLPDDARPYVEQAAHLAHKLFEEARIEGYRTGFLSSHAGARARFNRVQELMAKAWEELDEPANPAVENLLMRRMQRLHDEMDRLSSYWITQDDRLAAIADDIRDKAAKSANWAANSRAGLIESLNENIERDLAIFADLDARYADRGLSSSQEKLYRSIKERLDRLFERRIQGRPEELPQIIEDRNLKNPNWNGTLLGLQLTGRDVVYINPDEIERGWRDKIWRNQSARGPEVLPLDDDLFPTPEAFREFIIRHEIAHITNPQKRGETAGAYEARIDLEALRAGGKLTVRDYLRYATDKQRAYNDMLEGVINEPLSLRQREYMMTIEKRLDATLDDPMIGVKESDPFYFPRWYNIEAIIQDENGSQRFRQVHRDWFRSTAIQRGLLPDDAAIEARVDSLIKTLIENDGNLSPADQMALTRAHRFTFQMRRKNDIPSEEIMDFLETDMAKLMRHYMDQFGTGVELSRMFGTRDATDAIEDSLLQAAREGASEKKLADMEGDMIDLREMMSGDMYRRNELTWDGYTADMLKAWAQTTMLGRIIRTVAVEPGRLVMANGMLRTFGDGFDALTRNLDKFKEVSEELRLLVGEGWDTALGAGGRRFVTEGGYMGYSTASPLLQNTYMKTRGFIDFARGPYYILNLLSPATDAMKRFQNVMGSHFMIEDMKKVVSGQAGERVKARLLSLGFHPEDFARISSLAQKSGRLWMPATATWGDAGLVRRFAGAVAGETRRVIATGGAANRNRWMTGHIKGSAGNRKRFALAGLPFQFLQFPISGINKYILSMAQGRDASPLLGAMTMVGLGYVSSWLKASEYSWERMPMEERVLRSVEQSGVLAIFGDIPNMIEQASGNQLGIRPMMGLDPKFQYADELDQFTSPFGPGVDKIADMYRLFLSTDTDNRERARIMRRAIPLMDLIYWHDLFAKMDPYTEQALDGLN